MLQQVAAWRRSSSVPRPLRQGGHRQSDPLLRSQLLPPCRNRPRPEPPRSLSPLPLVFVTARFRGRSTSQKSYFGERDGVWRRPNVSTCNVEQDTADSSISRCGHDTILCSGQTCSLLRSIKPCTDEYPVCA